MGSTIIPLGFAAIKRRISKEFGPLLLALLVSLLCDTIAYFLASRSHNTHWLGNIYLIVQFSLLAWMFRHHFRNKKWNDIIVIAFIFFFTINLVFFQGPWKFNSISNVIAGLILISMCLYYFYRLLNDLPTIHIQHLPMLWISFGVLTYYGGNFYLFLVKNYLSYGETGSHKLMWIFHNLLNIVKNILFAIGLWKGYRRLRSSTLSSSVP